MKENISDRLTLIENYLKNKTDKPLTFQEAAEYLGISKSTLYKKTAKKKIPFYKNQGKLIYFKKSELNDWVYQGKGKT